MRRERARKLSYVVVAFMRRRAPARRWHRRVAPSSKMSHFTKRIHSCTGTKLDYCNSLYRNLPKSQTTRLQQIQNSLSRAAVKAPKPSHITPIVRSLHWLKITERIEYKLLSLTYKVLTTTQTFISA